MDCLRFETLAWRLLDAAQGEPGGPGELVELRGHLESCPACRSAWEEALLAREALRAAAGSEPRVPEAARARLLERAESILDGQRAALKRSARTLRARPSVRRGLEPVRPLAYGAAALAAAAAVLLALSYRVPPPEPAPTHDWRSIETAAPVAEPPTAPLPAGERRETLPVADAAPPAEGPGELGALAASEAVSGTPQTGEGVAQASAAVPVAAPERAVGPAGADASGHFAYVDAVEGRVEVLRRGGAGWTPARAGFAIAVGDRLRTGDARARLVLDSGTIVCVNRLTTLSPRALAPGAISLGSGELYVETVHADRGFVVETPHGRSRALGTRFDVASGALGTKVLVTEGQVEVSAGPATVTVPAGFETTLLRADLPPGRVQRASSVGRRLAWATGDEQAPAGARLVVWDGDDRSSAGFWVVPEGGRNWARPQSADARQGRSALEFHGEGAGYIGCGCNWRSWSRQGGTDVSGFRELVFWLKVSSGSGPEQLRIGLSSKGMKYTRQVEVSRYAPEAMDGRWHRVAIPLADLAEGSEFDPTCAWEIQFNTWSEAPRAWSLLVDEIAFEGRR